MWTYVLPPVARISRSMLPIRVSDQVKYCSGNFQGERYLGIAI